MLGIILLVIKYKLGATNQVGNVTFLLTSSNEVDGMYEVNEDFGEVWWGMDLEKDLNFLDSSWTTYGSKVISGLG